MLPHCKLKDQSQVFFFFYKFLYQVTYYFLSVSICYCNQLPRYLVWSRLQLPRYIITSVPSQVCTTTALVHIPAGTQSWLQLFGPGTFSAPQSFTVGHVTTPTEFLAKIEVFGQKISVVSSDIQKIFKKWAFYQKTLIFISFVVK